MHNFNLIVELNINLFIVPYNLRREYENVSVFVEVEAIKSAI